MRQLRVGLMTTDHQLPHLYSLAQEMETARRGVHSYLDIQGQSLG